MGNKFVGNAFDDTTVSKISPRNSRERQNYCSLGGPHAIPAVHPNIMQRKLDTERLLYHDFLNRARQSDAVEASTDYEKC